MSQETKKFSWAKCFLIVFPTWLLVSGGVGLYLHFQAEKKAKEERVHAFQKKIDPQRMADDFRKFTEVIGARHHDSPEGVQGLKSMASMIEGSLGPSNMGYEVTKIPGVEINGNTLPLLTADVLRRQTNQETWLLVPYDSDPTLPRGSETASAVAVGFAVAQELIGQPLRHNVRFLFFPGAYLEEDKRLELLAKMQRLIALDEKASQVLVLGSMLHQGSLHVLCRDSELPIAQVSPKLLTEAESGDICLNEDGETSTILYEIGLPAALLYSKSEEIDQPEIIDSIKVPATQLAAHADTVVKVIRELDQRSEKK